MYRIGYPRLLALLIMASLVASCAPATPAPMPEPAPSVTPPPTSSAGQSAPGRYCAFAGTGATLAFEGKRLNFTCSGEGGQEVGLLGDIAFTERGWEIEKGVIAHGDEGFSLESSEMVTVLHIELADGTTCAFAGTGATLAFEGKRLNFTCPGEGEEEVGLIGEVAIADQGWEIEKAVIAHGDEGFSLESSEMVQIAALIIESEGSS